jgi:GTP-binding protein EngB required for normal cell division
MMSDSYLIPITGRPNAGKSSLVNYLCHSRRPVGKKAGTTTKITTIPLVRNVTLIDLPGYGRLLGRSKQYENQLKDEILLFFEENTEFIMFGIHIIDFSTFHHMVNRLEMKGIIPIDLEMIQFIAEKTNYPPLVVLNKMDKNKPELNKQNMDLLISYSLPQIEIFSLSLKTKEGCRSLRNRIKEIIVQKLGSKYEHW